MRKRVFIAWLFIVSGMAVFVKIANAVLDYVCDDTDDRSPEDEGLDKELDDEFFNETPDDKASRNGDLDEPAEVSFARKRG